MSTLIITRGYPGSGKTTLAREWVAEDPEGRVRVNRDDLRRNLFGADHLTWPQEKAITTAQQAAVRALLEAGKNVIVDDTHLRLRHARAWADLAVELGAKLMVWDVETGPRECVDRDEHRRITGGRGVGMDAILEMAQRFPMPWPEVKPSERKADAAPARYEADPTMLGCWLFDIDGTLALMGDRNPYDTETVGDDEPNWPVLHAAHAVGAQAPLVIMSGRTEEARQDTEDWLDRHLGPSGWQELHMRAAGDNRKDFVVKAELFDAHVRDRWDVMGVFDDRQQVVDMWRAMGLTCFQVAKGDF